MRDNINKFYASGGKSRVFYAAGLELQTIAGAVADSEELSPTSRERMACLTSYVDSLAGGSAQCLSILIGGGSGTGKSTVAMELGYRFGFRNIIGTDMVREVLRGTPALREEPAISYTTYDCWKACAAQYDPASLKEGHRRQSRVVVEAAVRIISRALIDGEFVAVEGIHMLPTLIPNEVRSLPNVVSMVLCVTDPDVHRERLYDRGHSTHVRKQGDRYMPVFDKIRVVHDAFVNDANNQGVPVVDMTDPDAGLDTALDLVFAVLRRICSPRSKLLG